MRLATLLLDGLTAVVSALPAQEHNNATLPVGFTVPASPKTAMVAGEHCGDVGYKGSVAVGQLNKNDACFDLVDIVNRAYISNQNCGLCAFWNNHDCSGTQSDFCGPGLHQIADSMSYFCIP